MGMKNAIDLKPVELRLVRDLLSRHLGGTAVWAFGSRVSFTARPDSDLDLVAFTSPGQSAAVARLKEAFAESSLPFRVDLLEWDGLPDNFKKNIEGGEVSPLAPASSAPASPAGASATPLEGLPEGWKIVRIKEISEILGDGLHGTPEYDQSGDYYFINGNNLSNGYIKLSEDTKRISENEYRKYNKNLTDNTILVSINGTIGNVAYYKNEKIILGKSACYINVKEGINKKYIYYVLKSASFQYYLHQYSTGTTIKNVSLKQMREYFFTLPPFSQQQKIAAILSSLDDKIALNRATNQTLEQIAQALFKSWFVDFDPVRAKAAGRVPTGMDEATAALFPDSFEESELGPIPQKWEVRRVGDFQQCFDSKRVPLSKKQREQKKPGVYPYYGAASVMDYINEWVFDDIYLLIGEDGSVLNPDGTPIIQYIWGKTWVNNHAHVLQGINSVSTEHLMLFYQQCFLKPFTTGAVQLKLNQGNMNRIPFLFPGEDISVAFNKQLLPIYTAYRSGIEEVKLLEQLRDALLPKLLSGEISVAGAEG